MKTLSLLFFWVLFVGLSACYKEEQLVVRNLSGRYYCEVVHTSHSNGSPFYYSSTRYETVEFSQLLTYKRGLKLELEYSTFKFFPDLEDLSFNCKDNTRSTQLYGHFLAGDSVFFEVYPINEGCLGCGENTDHYRGKKVD